MTKALKLELLATMHDIMVNMNNEYAYSNWIYTVPDQPDFFDFLDIANNDKVFNEVIEDFCKILNRYKKDGCYYDDTEKLRYDISEKWLNKIKI